MKKKTAKQPKQSKRTAVKDLKPKKDASGGEGIKKFGLGHLILPNDNT